MRALKHISSIQAGLLILATLCASPVAWADMAGDFEASLTAIIDVVRAPEPDEAELARHIDFAAITRGVLGKHGKTLSEEQRTRFQAEFEKSMFALLRSATAAAGDFDIKVTQTKISEKRSTAGQAYANVIQQNGQKIAVIASVAQQADGWKVRNLIFDGVNLGLTYRNQFDELMNRHNGNADQAIDAWAQIGAQNAIDAE